MSLGGNQQAGRDKRQTHHPRGNYPRLYFEKGAHKKALVFEERGSRHTPVQVKVYHDGDDGHGHDGHGVDAGGCNDPGDHFSNDICNTEFPETFLDLMKPNVIRENLKI